MAIPHFQQLAGRGRLRKSFQVRACLRYRGLHYGLPIESTLAQVESPVCLRIQVGKNFSSVQQDLLNFRIAIPFEFGIGSPDGRVHTVKPSRQLSKHLVNHRPDGA